MSSPNDPQRHLNLEQQRKRAKDLRRAHHDRSLDAAVRIVRHLPRAQNQSPEQVLASEFTLSEAQFVVAREAGFTSWPRLKHHIEESEQDAKDLTETIIDAAFDGKNYRSSAQGRREGGIGLPRLVAAGNSSDTFGKTARRRTVTTLCQPKSMSYLKSLLYIS
jgi:hypothetical protein